MRPPSELPGLGDWLSLLERPGAALRRAFGPTYGQDAALLERRRHAYRALLQAFAAAYDSRDAIIVARAPARLNLMGVHVEHRRGEVNYVTHCREVLIAAQPRPDDRVVLRSVEPACFPDHSFGIGEELAQGAGDNWLAFIESPGVSQAVARRRGHWGNYIKSAVLRLQHRFPERKLCGMNLMVSGDIPISAGLSSSSALVVAAAVATVRLNDLDVAPAELVELCGQGEWYVGTRGGAGDHAAMICGRRNRIAHMRFFPFELLEFVPLPDGCQVVICNSLKAAEKSSAVLDEYNQTIAAYQVVLMLIKQVLVAELGMEEAAVEHRLNHLGDVNLNRGEFPDDLIYRVLRRIPPAVTREQLQARLPAQRAALERIFSTHDAPAGGYRARAVAMFGLAEIARGANAMGFLKRGDLAGFGELMYISHAGDRLVTFAPDGSRHPWDNERTRVTDDYLQRLLDDRAGGDPEKAYRASLMFQPGGFRCSCEELDQIVDLAQRVPGVLGAGLTGAGFGGCVLALAREQAVEALVEALGEEYYEPRGLSLAVETCVAVAGAGVVSL
jgi:N-acetylgalactosamine kinase